MVYAAVNPVKQRDGDKKGGRGAGRKEERVRTGWRKKRGQTEGKEAEEGEGDRETER